MNPMPILRSLRPHQWLKNLIVFVPIITSHQWRNAPAWGHAAEAFIVFCLAASGLYCINDVFDMDADREHPKKKLRPVAAGLIHRTTAYLTGVAICVVSMLIADGVSVQIY